LTADIERRLRRSAPDYSDWEEERALTNAAAVALRSVPNAPIEVDFGTESELANVLAQRPQEVKATIVDAIDRYSGDLDAIGLNDRQMLTTHRSRRSFLWRIIWNLIVGIVLLPFAVFGLVINIVPLALLWLIGRVKMAPAVAATVKPASAILLFSITWALVGWQGWTWSGIEGVAAVLLVMPLYLYALFALGERGGLVWRAWRGWWHANRKDIYAGVQEHRQDVVRAVSDAI
jgi:hypothetical protein